MFWIILWFVATLIISTLNAASVGAYWSEKDELPAGLQLSLWAGAIMAICGFFAVFIFPVTWLMQALHLFEVYGSFLGIKDLKPEDITTLVSGIYDMAYLLIIVPVIGSGFVIWIDSLIVAYQKRTLGSFAVAGWNTYAQVRNSINAIRYIPEALGDLGKIFKGKKGGQAFVYLLLILLPIVFSLGSAIVTTAAIMHAADERFQLDTEVRKQLA